MQTLAAGSRNSSTGFTLLELLVVVAIVAMVSAGVGLSLLDTGQLQLEREAQRLAALLESARARSRVMGVPVVWRASPNGFTFDGLAPSDLSTGWLDRDTQLAEGRAGEGPVTAVLLGPEPFLLPQEILLISRAQPGKTVRLATDGVRPFAVQTAP